MISIIVPVYRVEAYLPQCVESLMRQTDQDIEIILVDDGSPDKSPEICDAYARKDHRIHVIHQPNAGVSAARNAGLKTAKGEYIGFVDPDDWVSPDMFGAMRKAAETYQAELVICGYAYCHEDGTIDEKRLYEQKPTETLTQKDVMRRMSDMPPTLRHVVWNKLFRKSLLQGVEFPESLRSSEDVWFLAECLPKIKTAVFVHEPFCFNRVRDGSATHGGLSVRSLADSFQAHAFMYRVIVDAYPDLKDYSQAFLLDVYLLKYSEAKKKAKGEADGADLQRMRKALRREAAKALFNHEIYWKTRLAYLLA